MKEVDKKIWNIRTQYTREKGKMRKSKSGDGADDIYISKWQHYKQLSFLDAFVTAKSSRSNLQVNLKLNHVVLPWYTSSTRIEVVG